MSKDSEIYVPPEWEFVNLFHHIKEGLFYCRIRHRMEKREVTGSGATINKASWNAADKRND